MKTHIRRSLPSLSALYSTWLMLLYINIGHGYLSGTIHYRMEQVVDYLGAVPEGVSRSQIADVYAVFLLFSSLLLLWIGAVMIRLEQRNRAWLKWPISLFCVGVIYSVVHQTLTLESLYTDIVGLDDWFFASSTVTLMSAMILAILFSLRQTPKAEKSAPIAHNH